MDAPTGLTVLEDFVSEAEEQALIQALDQQHWAGRGVEPNPEMKRRHQHYGSVFSYRLRQWVGEPEPLPALFDFVTERLLERGIYTSSPETIIVNEYDAGQGIMPHVDAPKLFGPTITALSLLSACIMTFQHVKDPSIVYPILLPRRSLVIMNGPSRYEFKHSISKDLVEYHGAEEIVRSRRVSITYRSMRKVPAEEEESTCGSCRSPSSSIEGSIHSNIQNNATAK